MISKATERSFKEIWKKAKFNCGTTPKGEGIQYNLVKLFVIACIIQLRTISKKIVLKVKLERAQGECLGIRSRRRT